MSDLKFLHCNPAPSVKCFMLVICGNWLHVRVNNLLESHEQLSGYVSSDLR